MKQKYQICSRCVMDTTDPNIVFDSKAGTCNHCDFHLQTAPLKLTPAEQREEKLASVISQIKQAGKNKDYDCVMGLSGGVDSSYIALLAKKHGLRPLAIHLDNGWNSELAVKNIYNIVNKLKFDLYTHVIDWSEFKDLQRSFIKASVVDIELLTDHAITAIIYKMAQKHGIKYILSGSNFSTESIMPPTWYHRKSDLKNLLAIHKRFGEKPLKTFPTMSTLDIARKTIIGGIKQAHLLNIIDYNKEAAVQELAQEVQWRSYSGKHHESIFTRYYQAYILPQKFNIDKRKCHLSSLICSNQITRDQALEQLKEPICPEEMMREDGTFVQKKLGFSQEEWDKYIQESPRSHYAYASDQYIFDILSKYRKFVNKFIHV